MIPDALKGLKKFEASEILCERISDLIQAWSKSYPHIDIRSQIQWAHNWLLENPSKKRSDYVKYLGNWMRGAERRVLDRRTHVVHLKPYVEDRPKDDEIMSGEDWARMRRELDKNEF